MIFNVYNARNNGICVIYIYIQHASLCYCYFCIRMLYIPQPTTNNQHPTKILFNFQFYTKLGTGSSMSFVRMCIVYIYSVTIPKGNLVIRIFSFCTLVQLFSLFVMMKKKIRASKFITYIKSISLNMNTLSLGYRYTYYFAKLYS